MTEKGVTPHWRHPPFPLNIKYSVPHSTQNLIQIASVMINLQFKTNSLKNGSSVPSISLNYGRNLTKRANAGSGNVRDASGIYHRCITGIRQSSESGSHAVKMAMSSEGWGVAPGRKRPQNSLDRFSWYRKNKTSCKYCQQITRGGTSGGLQSYQQRGFRPLFRRFMGSVDSKTGGSQMRTL